MSPNQKDFSAEATGLRTMWKSSGDNPCDNAAESDSWASDAESSTDPESRKNSINVQEGDVGDEQPEGYLDSGFEDSGNFQLTGEVSETGKSEDRKIQSILRAEPQVFKVYDKKDRKKKKHAVSNEPRKSVGFIFPEGIRIPERVSHKRSRTPIRHFKVLKQKLKGESDVPWRPSAHTIGKAKPLNAQLLKVDEGSSRGNQLVIRKAATLGDLKLKKIKPSEFEDDEVEGFETDQEEGSESNNSDCDDLDSKSEDGKEDEEEQEDEELIMTRRKALRYHFRSIVLASTVAPKKVVKKTPSFPTAGHGVGHARRHYPHAPSHHHYVPHFASAAHKKAQEEADNSGPSIVVTAPEDLQTEYEAMSNMNPDPESAELTATAGFRFRRSSSQGSLDRVLSGLARLFDSNGSEQPPAARPGKIVRMRYRRMQDDEPFPSIE